MNDHEGLIAHIHVHDAVCLNQSSSATFGSIYEIYCFITCNFF